MAGKTMSLDEGIRYARKMARGESYEKPLKVCIGIMESGVKKCFAEQASPDGRPWAPHSSLTKKLRPGGKILKDSGLLLASISSKATKSEAQTGAVGVKAAAQNNGARIPVTPKMRGYFLWKFKVRLKKNFIIIPARPFIGHRPENLPKYDKVFADFRERQARTG